MRRTIVLIVSMALVLSLAGLAVAGEANEWGQYQKDSANTGALNVTVPDKATVGRQNSKIDARDGSQPVVSGNLAYVYTGIDDTSGSIVCLDMATGETVWKTAIEPPTLGSWSSPAVSEGRVYIGSGSRVYALDALSGARVWVRSLGSGSVVVNSSPTIDGDRLFIGDWNNNNKGAYFCLDTKTGAIVWKFALDADCHAQSTPAVDGNRVYVGQFGAQFGVQNGKVWCLDRNTGKPVGSWGTKGYFSTVDKLDVTGSIAVEADRIYFTDFTFGAADEPNSHLYCLNKSNGKQVWRTDVFPTSGTPAVGGGMVVVACNQWGVWPGPSTNWTYAFRADPGSGAGASRLWQKKGVGGFNMSSSIVDGRVLVGNFDANSWSNSGVYCLEAGTGRTVWSSDKAGSVPVPTEYGVLSVGGGGLVTFGARAGAKGDFYFAEGCTREGYQEWICLENSSGQAVQTEIQYALADGTTRVQQVPLPAASRTTVDVNLFLGPGHDVAARVTGDGPFVAERAMYVSANGTSGGEQVMGAAETGRNFLFAEGTTRDGYQLWLALQNPGDREAAAIVTYLYDGKPPRAENVVIPATSRKTIDVNSSAGAGEDVSISVTANSDIAAERVMYFVDPNPIMGAEPAGVHNSTGTREPGTRWYFAEGTTRSNFRQWLCLMNPGGQEATATIQYLTFDRGTVTKQRTVPPNSRVTVNVNTDLGAETDLSMLVTSDREIVAERPMYCQYIRPDLPGEMWGGGHNTVGAPYSAYQWEFAEGTTRPGYQTYLCIANPNAQEVEVSVEYIVNDGGANETSVEKVKVPASSRRTVDVNEALGAGKDVSFKVTCAVPVVAERAMYFNANGYEGAGASLGFVSVP